MGTMVGGATKPKEGKKPHVNRPTSKKYMHYKIVNGKIVRDKYCPRCGPGIFLASSKKDGRVFCGRCGYTEFANKSPEAHAHSGHKK